MTGPAGLRVDELNGKPARKGSRLGQQASCLTWGLLPPALTDFCIRPPAGKRPWSFILFWLLGCVGIGDRVVVGGRVIQQDSAE